ncbi:MAG: AEC family transporter [Kiritimatiellae bacterium]|nr:AEC family transporter [Kiritimatiellia bacterium]
MQYLGVIIDTLAPVFLVVLLGAVLRRAGFLTERFASELNRFVFWVSLPAFLFLSIARSGSAADSVPAAATMMASTLAIAAVAYLGAPLFGIPPRSRGTFCQCVFRSNNAYVGLPVIAFAFGGAPIETQMAVHSLAALSLAPCLVLYNILAVIVLMPNEMGAFDGNGAAAGPARPPVGRILRGIARNPLIIGCLSGAAALAARSALGIPPGAPVGTVFIDRTLNQVGSLAGPGALLALGASLTPERIRAAWRPANAVAFLKLAACPLFGLLFASLLHLDGNARLVALIYLTCPTAVASFVMAQQMKGDAAMAGAAVALTTLYSSVALAILLAMHPL